MKSQDYRMSQFCSTTQPLMHSINENPHNISILKQSTPYDGKKNVFDPSMFWKEVVRRENIAIGKNIVRNTNLNSSVDTSNHSHGSTHGIHRREHASTTYSFPQDPYRPRIKITDFGKQQMQGSIKRPLSSTTRFSPTSGARVQLSSSPQPSKSYTIQSPRVSSNQEYGRKVSNPTTQPVTRQFNKTKKFGDQFYKQPSPYGFIG